MKFKLYGIIANILCLGALIVVISCGDSSSEEIETSTNIDVLEQNPIAKCYKFDYMEYIYNFNCNCKNKYF